MKIRPINVADIADVANTHAASWKVGFKVILSNKLLDNITVQSMKETWEEIITRKNRRNLVAEIDQSVIGFISFETKVSGVNDGEIIGIYVHPDFWRTGAGESLMSEALNEMRSLGFRTVYLWTMTNNYIARNFYEKMRFDLSGESRNSERNGENFEEVKFTKQINEAIV